MFTMLGRALARVLFFRETRSYESALLELDNTGLSLLGLNTETLERLPLDGLKSVLGSESSLLQSRLYTAGVLMKEKAEIVALMGREEESAGLFMKSLRMMTEDIQGMDEIDEGKAIAAIDRVIAELSEYEIPVELKTRMVAYFEQTGRYDKSEDLIFEIIDESPEFLQEGISLYERLLNKSDAELERGHLPRDEVNDALALLRKKLADVTQR